MDETVDKLGKNIRGSLKDGKKFLKRESIKHSITKDRGRKKWKD